MVIHHVYEFDDDLDDNRPVCPVVVRDFDSSRPSINFPRYTCEIMKSSFEKVLSKRQWVNLWLMLSQSAENDFQCVEKGSFEYDF